ncbi:MAG: flagellar biosynthesis protein FlhF [Clostridiales bacterium 38-18]|nr:MAG: flagellar biosynthesis protein FlhF [Clostridiales bacterium 38-18]
MKVKRYIVNDMNEAMIKIKSELGIDAVILNTRKIKAGGFFKFFKKPLLEVVAAVDEPVVTKPIQRPKRETDREAVVREPEIIAEKPLVNQADKLTESMQKNDNNELQELKLMVSDLIKKVETIEHMSPQKTVSAEEKYIEFLTGLDIQESIAKKIIEIVQRQINIHEKNHDTILNAMKVIAREYLGEIKTIDTDMLNKPNVYIFLGPTGVGKTTTLAKIAARLSLIDNKKIGLITADTYRIAAVEQLKTYSEILGIPLEVIYEASELHDAIEKFKDKDYILIDTAGRSHKSKELKSDYDDLVKYLDDYKIFLVMSMTTSFKDMKSIIDSYNFLKEYRLLFTKLDESSNFGNILNLKVLTGKPLSYFTIGQSVPDDIEVADKERIIQYIFDQHK